MPTWAYYGREFKGEGKLLRGDAAACVATLPSLCRTPSRRVEQLFLAIAR